MQYPVTIIPEVYSVEAFREMVPYFTQLNNRFNPTISCFPTAVAQSLTAISIAKTGSAPLLNELGMSVLVKFLAAKEPNLSAADLNLDDIIWCLCNAPETTAVTLTEAWMHQYAPNMIYNVEKYVIENYFDIKFDCEILYNVKPSVVEYHVRNGVPCVLGTKLYGGHMISLLGMESSDEYIVADPYRGDFRNNAVATNDYAIYPTTIDKLTNCMGLFISTKIAI